MKITEICESTTSGSVATVAAPMNGGPLKRSAVGKGVYGKEPAGSMFKGKKPGKPFANSKLNEEGGFPGEKVTVIYVDGKSLGVKYAKPEEADKALNFLRKKYPNKKIVHKQEVNEAGMPAAVIKHKQKLTGMNDAELAERLKDKSDDELKKMAERHGYGKMSPHYVNRVKKGKEIKENELRETDLIIGPGQGHRLKSGFISRAEDRRDHEVEMARSDLHQAHKNSSKIHKLIKNVSEDDGLEGWVQAKITKAADYLNSVCQYLEGKQLREMTGGVIAGGGVGEAADPIEKRITVKKWGGNDDHSWAVLVDGKPAVTGLSKREVPYHKSLVMKRLKEKPQLTGTNLEEGKQETYNLRDLGNDLNNYVGSDSESVLVTKILNILRNNYTDSRGANLPNREISGSELMSLYGISARQQGAFINFIDKVYGGPKKDEEDSYNSFRFDEEADLLDEGMDVKKLAAMAAAAGFALVPNNVGDGTNRGSSADRAYDTYLSQTPSHLVPRYTTPIKGK
jgi:hypothetical protein